MNGFQKYSVAACAMLLAAGVLALPAPARQSAPPAPGARLWHSTQFTPIHPAANGILRLAYDSDKCISSCDMQYSTCENNGNENGYCSQQHNACVAACLKYKG